MRCDCGYDFQSGTPGAALPGAALSPPAQAPAWALETLAILLLTITSCQAGILNYEKPISGEELGGVVLAPALIATVVAVVARLFRSGRSRRVRARAVVVALLALFLWNTGTCMLDPKREGSVGDLGASFGGPIAVATRAVAVPGSMLPIPSGQARGAGDRVSADGP